MRLNPLQQQIRGPCTYATMRSVSNLLATPFVAPNVYSDIYYYSSRLTLTKAMDFSDTPPSKYPT